MVPVLTSPDLSEILSVRHGFFTRQGGVSTGDFTSLNASITKQDNPNHVQENRRRICEALEGSLETLVTIGQNHTNKVVFVDKPFHPDHLPEADALITMTPNLTLGVTTADCVPILLSHDSGRVIAAIHAGWRGAISGVIQNTLAVFAQLGCEPEDIGAALGPCIWPDSYEVDEQFYQSLQGTIAEPFFDEGHRPHHWQFDLPGYVTAILEQEGVEYISPSPYNTFSNEELFFSCRRKTLNKESAFGCQLSAIRIIE